MDFEKLFEELKPALKGIALKERSRSSYIDAGDLFQEMSVHLWEKWKNHETEGCTASYVLQGCWFHAKNCLRKAGCRETVISFDEPLWAGGPFPEEVISGEEQALEYDGHSPFAGYDSPESLTERERTVFEMTLAGYTLRETGEKLGISHVMVSRILKNVRKKAEPHYLNSA